MANTYGRLDGFEKAEQHIAISETLVSFILCSNNNHPSIWKEVHDYLSDILTSQMDEVIGFPTDRRIYDDDYDILVNKFFNVIVDHIDEIENIVKRSIK